MLAGALAEQGVQSTRIIPADGPVRECHARTTDLPGVIAGLTAGDAIEVPAVALRVVRTIDGLFVQRADSPQAARVADALAPRA